MVITTVKLSKRFSHWPQRNISDLQFRHLESLEIAWYFNDFVMHSTKQVLNDFRLSSFVKQQLLIMTWHAHCWSFHRRIPLTKGKHCGASKGLLSLLLVGTGCSLRWRHSGGDSVSNHHPHHCLLNRLFRRRSKKTSKLRVTGLCAGNSPGTGEFPAQMASNAENVSIWWRHHVNKTENWFHVMSL